MILRRFMQHMKEQNWFAVGLDVIVVIVGIFLGLQVQEWYEDRIDRVDEKLYLERILSDMKQSETLQISQIERLEILNPLLDNIAKSFHNKKKQEGFDKSFILSQINQAASARPLTVFVTIDELKSAGKFNLIKSEAIRIAIGELQQSYVLTMDLTQNRQRYMAGFLPILASNYTSAFRGIDWHADYLEVSKSFVMEQELFQTLSNNDEFVSSTGWAHGLNDGQLKDLKEHFNKTKNLTTLISDYLQKSD